MGFSVSAGFTSNFAKVQWFSEEKGDWTALVKKDLKDLCLNPNLEFYEDAKKDKLKKEIKERCKNYALSKFQNLQKNHSKMRNLVYSDLNIQNYFQRKDISLKQKQMIFRSRTYTEKYKNNFKNKYEDLACIICRKHIDDQESVFMECNEFSKQLDDDDNDLNYKDIFTNNIPLNLIKKLTRINKVRSNFEEQMTS